ncbi:hypothetical protein DES39_0562 [Orbus hercynius]|uniref:Cyanophage baseplate Pam3 plug gp18 domain-containing protein n=1 Tax=Orbus hercynius TaxID=593135 RepID=A0A495RIV3_9GAMM|nr:hypothetical protein [Orbus hercynius]RKS87341.1 hypothetical protein DES39_0562 [Orbus hercynius]
MLTISLEKKEQQSFGVNLGGQNCTVTLSQQDKGLFFSMYMNEKPIALNVLCLNDVKLVRYKYLGFIGDLFFNDSQGNDNPTYSELGDRFSLYYDGDA